MLFRFGTQLDRKDSKVWEEHFTVELIAAFWFTTLPIPNPLTPLIPGETNFWCKASQKTRTISPSSCLETNLTKPPREKLVELQGIIPIGLRPKGATMVQIAWKHRLFRNIGERCDQRWAGLPWHCQSSR